MAKQSFERAVQGLRSWNGWLAVAFTLQGIAILVLSVGKSFSITAGFLARDPLQSQITGQPVLVSATRHLFDVNLAYMTALFLFVAAAVHLLAATTCRRQYETDVRKRQNRLRWMGYILSGGALMLAMSLLAGVRDGATLLSVFVFVTVASLCGLAAEISNQAKARPAWLSYFIGGIAVGVAWLVLAGYLLAGALYGSAAPAHVYWLLGSVFVLSSGFAVNLYLQIGKTGQWKEYLRAERMYMVLNLVVLSAAAWQIFAGSLRP